MYMKVKYSVKTKGEDNKLIVSAYRKLLRHSKSIINSSVWQILFLHVGWS